MNIPEIYQVLPVAEMAGKAILKYHRKDVSTSLKADASPVTEADLESNQIIVTALSNLTPKVPILAEESETPPYSKRKDWDHFWLVDPLDGTKEFLKGTDEFTVNIALVVSQEPILGIVYAPALGEMYFAAKGEGSWRKKNRAAPERIYSRSSEETLILVESRSHRSMAIDEFAKKHRIIDRVQVGSALKFAYLADGRATVYARFNPCMEWDVAAGDCLYRNAAPSGVNQTPFVYNRESLEVDPFVIGMD